MATVQFSDVIDVTVFNDLPAVDSPEKTAFVESGVVVATDYLNTLADAPSKTVEMPFWNDIDPDDVPNLSNDNPASVAVPKKVTQGDQIARKLLLNQGWSVADVVNELTMGPKAMEHIRAKVDKYWTRRFQKRLIAAAAGIQADNVANDSGDMTIAVAAEATGSQTAATRFSRTNFTAAAFTLGDAFDSLGIVCMHSVVYKQAVDQDDIDFIPDSKGSLTIPTYLGHRVIVDDSMTVTAGSTSGFKYTTILFGAGAFGYGQGTPHMPTEIEREASQGQGGGIETLWSRKTWLIHPAGFAYTGTPAGFSPSVAEYAAAASWNRVVDRKNVPMAFLVTN